MTQDIEVRRRRAQYRADHRGTKEMDWMLGKFAAKALPDMVDPDLADFELLLTVSDPEIQTWLLEPAACDQPRYHKLIPEIRDFHKLGQSN